MRHWKILVVEDFDPFRQFALLSLRRRSDFEEIHEASDGLEALRRVEELQPDLVLLDIGLPGLNGIEVGRRIRKICPLSKILFVSQESSADVVQTALEVGAQGYVLKADAARELLPAVDAVLQGREYLSRRLRHSVISTQNEPLVDFHGSKQRSAAHLQIRGIDRVHKVAFYRDDGALLDDFTSFIEAALGVGNPIIVIAAASRRTSILQRLKALGWNMATAIQQGGHLSLDVNDILSKVMVNDLPDPTRFLKVASDLIMEAAKTEKGEHFRVAICGECSPHLISLGKLEAAIQLEQLWDKIARSHDVDILCGYSLGDFQGEGRSQLFERISVEHSTTYCP